MMDPQMIDGMDPQANPDDPGIGADAIDPNLPLEAFNLVPMIQKMTATDDEVDGQEWLDKQGRKVVETCQKDEEARKKFMDRRANQLKLYAGILKPLEFPAEGARAPHLPILLQAMLSLWSRIWDQICPAKGDIVHIQVVGPEDEERRLRVEKHMNWQVRSKMPDWASSHAASIMQWLLGGSMFRDYCWNPIEERNQIDHVPIDDLVIPYSETDLHPLMPEVGRKTRKRRLAKHTLLLMEEKGYYCGIKDLYDGVSGDGGFLPTGNSNYTDVSKVKDAAMTIDGIRKPETGFDSKDPDAKRELFEQHIWLEIPGTKKLRPVKVVVDVATKKVISLTVREIDDPIDKQRYDLEMQEYDATMASMAAAQPPMGAPPVPPEAEGPPDQMSEPMGEPPAEAAPPEMQGPPKPKPCKKKTLHTIVHYRLFPNPEGFYGLGAGYLLENSNDLVDSLIADVMVAGKFENMKMGFISEHAQGNLKGDVKMVPGTFKSLSCLPEELGNAVHEFKFSPPSVALVNLAEMLMNKAETQAANQEILSGEQGGSRETAKSMQIRTANAMTVVNVMTRLYLEPLKYEFKLMAHGNSVFLTDQEYFYVTEPSKTVPGQNVTTQNTIGRNDYLEDYDLTFTADARASSKPERISDAMDMLNTLTQNPVIMQSDPQRGKLLVYLALKQVFTEMEKPDFIAGMGPPPPPAMPPPPPTPQSQVTENAGFLNETDHPVLPDDNDLEHLNFIQQFEESPHAKSLSSTGKNLLERHKRAHVASHYTKMQGAINGQGAQAGMGGGPGGAGGISGGPHNGQGPGMPPGGGGPPGGPSPGGMQNQQPGGHPV